MIISKIQYGLGNQLFQYAFAKRLAFEKGEELVINQRWYEDFDTASGVTSREFQLSKFNIPTEYFTSVHQENKYWLPRKVRLKIRKFSLRWYLRFGDFEFWAFKGSLLDPIVEAKRLKRDIYVSGEWMNYRFYGPIRNILLDEFELSTPISSRNQVLFERIISSNSVFVHIRRGDYIKKRMHDLGGICTFDYYQRGMDKIKSNTSNPEFYFFSDDLTWVKESFGTLNNYHYVEGNENDPVADFGLMKACKHAIISNSTFSWWAAWLIKEQNAVIVSPDVWNKAFPELTNALIPNNWIRITNN
jgi:hypothetical protein